ncbi:MAG: ECF transporter S component [Provencibacterium sp.]|jgi:uncharacterized membrane protein|nr:ECF transporter S component [Provencibacterium sp.]
MENAVKKSRFGTYDIVFIGVMSAVVFAANFLSIPLGDVTRIHFGNVFCALSGLLLGPLSGGLCAGLGSFFYDLCNPLYAAEAPITFLMKFALGALAGLISHMGGRRGKSLPFNIAGSVTGSLCYVALYLLKNFIKQYFLLKNPIDTVWVLMITKGTASLVNAIIAVVVAVLICPVFHQVVERSGLGAKLSVR